MNKENEDDIKILDMFYQEGDSFCGIPPCWCVQYKRGLSSYVEYEYFKSWTEANEWAMGYGYND